MRASLEALSVLDAYTVGFLASESNANSSSPRQTQFSHAVLGTGKYPNAVKFLEVGAEIPADEIFEERVDYILNGIQAGNQSGNW
jgi:hypothetical protein